MQLSLQARTSIIRALRVFALAVLVLGITSVETFIAGNGLDLAPTLQSFVMVVAVPILAGADKWARWQQQSQP